nr:MAG TPA: ATPase [Bacteriophage sp.]
MILFTILLLTFAILATISVIVLSAGGAAFIVVFGDVFVCMLLIVWIMKRLLKRKKK